MSYRKTGKPILAAWLAGLLAFVVWSIWNDANAQETADICVSGNGDNNNNGSYPNNCYRELAEALRNVSNGDTVCMRAGRYDKWRIDNDDITIRLCEDATLGDAIFEKRDETSSTTCNVINGKNADVSGWAIDPTLASYGYPERSKACKLFETTSSGTNFKLHDGEIIGPFQTPEELGNDRSGGTRYGIIQAGAPGWHMFNIKTRYFNGAASGGNHDGALIENNDFRYHGHTMFRLEQSCKNQSYRKVGAVFRNNIVSGVVVSDFMQQNRDTSSNPNPALGPYQYSCIGGIAIVNNIIGTTGEQPLDGKGGQGWHVEGNVFFNALSDSDGPYSCRPDPCTPANLSGGGTSRGQPYTSILHRDNLWVDTGNIIGGKWYGTFQTNGTIVNAGRNYYGPLQSATGRYAGSGNYGGDFGIQNTVIDGNVPGRTGYYWDGSSTYGFFDGNIWGSGGRWCRMTSGNCSTYYETFSDWQSYMGGQNLAGKEQNSIEALSDEMFVTPNIQSKVWGGYWWDYDVEQLIADLQAGVYEVQESVKGKNTTDGGEPLATVTQSSTAGKIFVGYATEKFCCDAEEIAAYGGNWPADTVLLGGNQYTITDLENPKDQGTDNPGGGWIQLDASVSASVGDPVDVVYPGGHTSRAIGSRGYWRGPDHDPGTDPEPPPPSRPPPPYIVTASADDAQETSGVMAIADPSVSIGVTLAGSGSGSQKISIATGADDARISPSSGWKDDDRQEWGTNENLLIFRDLTIPADAQCTSASIDVTAYSSASSIGTSPVYVLDSHDPQVPASGSTIRPALDSIGSVDWTITGAWNTGETHTSDDLCALITARQQAPGWTPGASDVGFFIDMRTTTTGKRLFDSYDTNQAGAAELSVSWIESGTGGDATEVGLIMPTDIAQTATVTGVSLNFQAANDDSSAAAWTIAGLVSPSPAFGSAGNDISSRSLTAATATCASIPAWTAGEFYILTDTECPNLSSVVSEVVSSSLFDGRVGLVITGTGTRRATTYDSDPADVIGMDASWTVDYTPSCAEVKDQTLLTGTPWSYTVECQTPGKTECPVITADFSDLPGGHDATITPDADPQVCEALVSWPTPDRSGQPHQVVITGTDSGSSKASSVTMNLRVYNGSQDEATLPVKNAACDIQETIGQPIVPDDQYIEMTSGTIGALCWDIPIDSGSVVVDARVQFMAGLDGTAPAEYVIQCEDADDSAVFTQANPPSARTLTSLSASWTAALWAQDSAQPNEQTANIRRPMQEVIDRAGWVGGNTLSCFVTGSSGSRTAYATEATDYIETAQGPQLILVWAPSGTRTFAPLSDEDTASEGSGGVETGGDLQVGSEDGN